MKIRFLKIIIIIILFTFNSCGIFTGAKIYQGGNTKGEKVATISKNELIGIADTTKINISGKVIRLDYQQTIFPYQLLEVAFKDNYSRKIFKTTTDFDGVYKLYVDPGNYELLVKNEDDFPEPKIIGVNLDLKSGEIREIDITAYLQITTESILYKNKRAFKEAQLKRD